MNTSDRTLYAIQGKTFPVQQGENSALTWTLDWSSSLQTDSILTSAWSCRSNGLSISGQSTVGNVTSARFQGKPGRYTITNKITTSAGETDERQILLTITGESSGPLGEYV